MGKGALLSVGSGVRGEFVGKSQEGGRVEGRRRWTKKGAACAAVCSSIAGRR